MTTALSIDAVDNAIFGLLRGDRAVAIRAVDVLQGAESAWEQISFHGAGPLVAQLLANVAPASQLQSLCREEALRRAAWELAHRQLLSELLDCLQSAGVRNLLLKGTALAYSRYASPFLRVRGDTDILVDKAQFRLADEVLRCCGFAPAEEYFAEAVVSQRSFVRSVAGLSHCIDLHWSINNSPLLSRLWSDDELFSRSISIEMLHPSARGLGTVDALLLACVHRMTHMRAPYYVAGRRYLEANRAIWLYDIHLLVDGLSDADCRLLVELASIKGVAATLLTSLLATRSYLGSRLPTQVIEELEEIGSAGRADTYLNVSSLRAALLDVAAIQSWGARRAYLQQSLFPPRNYMRGKYAENPHAPLSLLYARRFVQGLLQRIRE